jgi:hypothetical protein
MGDKDPKSIEKLKEQAEDKKEEAIEYRHETPAKKQRDNEREEASEEAKVEQQYGEEPEPTEG